MDTKPIYLDDSYKKSCKAKVVSITDGNLTEIVLDQTVFYPVGGGQPSDQGTIKGKNGTLKIHEVILKGTEIVHRGKLVGKLKEGGEVICTIDWSRRYHNMKVHSAGHILHEAIKEMFPELTPIEAEHGKKSYIKYSGNLDEVSVNLLTNKANQIVKNKLPINTEFVSLEELKRRSPWVPEHLPKNKPLRIMWIGNYPPIPDGGTQVKNTSEVGEFTDIEILNQGKEVYIFYKNETGKEKREQVDSVGNTSSKKISKEDLINTKNQAIARITDTKDQQELENIRIELFGRNGQVTLATKELKNLKIEEIKEVGILINEIKKTLEKIIQDKKNDLNDSVRKWFDITIPGIKPKLGHLHLVTHAIDEISKTFENIGFVRARYPEVEWDYFAFESLNMPVDHAARDEWETFFVDEKPNKKYGQIVLTPHTSSGQVREMLRVEKPPIRMINIAKCYRRQSDVSHYPMFHQFEGLVIDEGISIINLKGTLDYFAKNFFGEKRKTRLRPYHFQFTEPSFEVDISCDICNGQGCKLCKAGWLELGGAGMVHPNVLKAGKIDTKKYTGFAFGWGVERTFMMKAGLSIPDIRLLYSSDLNILNQY